MCVGEAALYGDLVRHLRAVCAREAAERNFTTVEAEASRLDGLIRDWFFTPQGVDLGGHTPRDYIRAEQLTGRGPVVPLARLPDWLREEYEEMQRFGVALGEADVHVGYAPETTLLDDFDPDGAKALYEALCTCPICEIMNADDPLAEEDPPVEASNWLNAASAHPGFVPERFESNPQALAFVEQLYRLGAAAIEVDSWHSFTAPDALCVRLPADRRSAADLYTLWITEMVVRQGLDPLDYAGPGELIFAWPRLTAGVRPQAVDALP